MSKQEIVDGYLGGSISRRTFVRRITAAGLSVGAALSYADLLGAKSAHARPGHPDFYGDYYDCDFYDYYDCGTGSPDAKTQDPTNIEQSSALGHGLVDPNGHGWIYKFQYRPVGAFGALETDWVDMAPANDYVPVSALLSGLAPATDYEYRVVVKISGPAGDSVTVFAKWVRFKTAAPGSGGSGGGGGTVGAMAVAASTLGAQPPLVKPDGPAPGTPKIRIGALPALSSVQKTHIITIPVTVDQEADVTAFVKKGRRHVVKRARKSAKPRGLVRVAGPGLALTRADKTVKVKLRLTRTGVRLLKDRKAVNVMVEVEAVNRDGVTGVLRSTVHLVH